MRPGDAVTEGQALVQVDVERLALDLSLARANLESTRAQLALAAGPARPRAGARGAGRRGRDDAGRPARPTSRALQADLAAQEDQVAAAELALAGADGARRPSTASSQARVGRPRRGGGRAARRSCRSWTSPRSRCWRAAPVAAGARIRPGQAVEVHGRRHRRARASPGEVARVAPVAEEGTRTITVYVRLDNPDGTLLGGMFATGRIVTERGAPTPSPCPAAALREDDDGAFVLAIEDGALARRAVEAGRDLGGRPRAGRPRASPPGDRVVTAASRGSSPAAPSSWWSSEAMWLTRVSVSQPVFATMVMLAITILGLASLLAASPSTSSPTWTSRSSRSASAIRARAPRRSRRT